MLRNLPILILGAALAGCTAMTPAAGGGAVAVDTVYSGAFCGSETAGARWLDDRHAVTGYLSGDETGPVADGSATDFAERGVVAVSMGQRPTGGYAVRLAEGRARIADGVLTLPVDWREPPADALTTQVITRPCLLVAVPRDGYERVQLVDGQGVLRGEVVR